MGSAKHKISQFRDFSYSCPTFTRFLKYWVLTQKFKNITFIVNTYMHTNPPSYMGPSILCRRCCLLCCWSEWRCAPLRHCRHPSLRTDWFLSLTTIWTKMAAIWTVPSRATTGRATTGRLPDPYEHDCSWHLQLGTANKHTYVSFRLSWLQCGRQTRIDAVL